MNTDVLILAIRRRWPVFVVVAAATLGLFAWRTANTPPGSPVAVTKVVVLPDHRVPVSWATPVIPPYQSFNTKLESIESNPTLLRAAELARGDRSFGSPEFEEPWIVSLRREGIENLRTRYGSDVRGIERLAARIGQGLETRHIAHQQVVEISLRADTERDAMLFSWAIAEAAHQLHDERMRREAGNARARLEREIEATRVALTEATLDRTGVATFEREMARQRSLMLGRHESDLAHELTRIRRALVRNRAGRLLEPARARIPLAARSDVERITSWLVTERVEAFVRSCSITPNHPEMQDRAHRIRQLQRALSEAVVRYEAVARRVHRDALKAEKDDLALDFAVLTDRRLWVASEQADWIAAFDQIRRHDLLKEDHLEDLRALRALDRKLRWFEQALSSPVVVLSPAVAAYRPPTHGPTLVTWALLLSGLLTLTALVVVQGDRLLDTLQGAGSVSESLGLPLIGVIPRERRRRRNRDVPLELIDDDRFDPLAVTLVETARQGGGQSIALASTRAGEGRSAVAIGLAASLARRGLRVALVDGDLRAPTIHTRLGLAPGNGIAACLTGANIDADAEGWTLQASYQDTLHVLTSSPLEGDQLPTIDSSKVRALVDVLTAEYDFVLIDTPAIDRAADALSIARVTDATLLVAEAYRTPAAEVARTVGMLKDSRANPVGVILQHFPFDSARAIRRATDAQRGLVPIVRKGLELSH